MKNSYRLYILASLFLFLLAAATGSWFRGAMVGFPAGSFDLGNIRHAHSHLMFFGWVSMVPFLSLLSAFRSYPSPLTYGAIYSFEGLFWLGLATYPAFLLFGYEPVRSGSANLPFSVMLSGTIMLLWYVMIAIFLYQLWKWNMRQNVSKRIWTAALLMLFVCSLGAWFVAVAQFLFPAQPMVAKASTNFFLTVFTEGWASLFAVAIIQDQLAGASTITLINSNKSWKWLLGLLILGAILLFPVGLPESAITYPVLMMIKAGALILGISYIVFLYSISSTVVLHSNSIYRWPILFLVLKTVMIALLFFLPKELWAGSHQLKILYLHTTLLGFSTLVLFAWVHIKADLPRISYHFLGFSVLLLWLSLLPYTPLFPMALRGSWVLYFAATASIFPFIAALIIGIQLLRNHKNIVTAQNL